MNRTVRVLRVVLPVVIIGFLALLVVTYSANVQTSGSNGDPIVSAIRPDDRPQLVTSAFEDTQTIGGRVVSKIRARKMTGFKSGWYTLENVELTIFRANGLTYQLTADQAQFHAETKEAEAKGNVQLNSSDGIEIATAEIRFNGSRIENRIPVRFRIDRWEGNAGGVDVALEQEMLRLVDRVEARLVPQAQEQPVTISGQQAAFDRTRGEVTFSHDVVVQRTSDTLRAERITARLEQQSRRLTGLDGAGNVVVDLAADSEAMQGSERSEQTRLTAESFFAEVGPDGTIEAINVLGEQVPAHVRFLGVPEREVFARQFRMAVADGLVKEVKATGDVRLQELGELPRVITSKQATVHFDRAGKPASALVEGELLYRDGHNEVRGERATLDVKNDRLILSALPGAAPTLTSGRHMLRAQLIDISPKQRIVRGSGQVTARIVPSSKGADGGTIFSQSDQPVFINSDAVVMRQGHDSVFSGNVRAWQQKNTLFANELRMVGSGEVIQARGNVRTVLYNAKDARSSEAPVKSRSDTLSGRRSDSRVELDGNVTIEDATRSLSAGHAVFTFADEGGLQKVEVTNEVVLTEKQTGRKGSAESATYDVVARKIRMKGSPAEIADPQGAIKGAEIAVDLDTNRIDVISGEKPTEATYRQPAKGTG